MDNQKYLNALKKVLDENSAYVDEKLAVEFATLLSNFASSFGVIYNVALKQSLISHDPYSDTERIKKLTVLKEMPIDKDKPPTDGEISDYYSLQFSLYKESMRYILNNYRLSGERTSLKEIRLLQTIVNFVHWNQLFVNSESTATRFMANICDRLKRVNEKILIEIVVDAINQCKKLQVSIINLLESLAKWKVNELAYSFREDGFANHDDVDTSSYAAYVASLTKMYESKGVKLPSEEIILKVFQEDYTPSGIGLKKQVIYDMIDLFKVEDTAKELALLNLKSMLFDCLPTIGKCGDLIASAIAHIRFNSDLIYKKPKVLKKNAEKIKKILRNNEHTLLYILPDKESGKPDATINIDVSQFELKVKEKLVHFDSVNKKVGLYYKKLIELPNEKMCEEITSLIKYLENIKYRFILFNDFFRLIKYEDHDFKMFQDLTLEIKQIEAIVLAVNGILMEYAVKAKNLVSKERDILL